MINNDTIRKVIENIRQTPKIGRVEEFGELTSFLLSEKNNWITGQIFHIDGVKSTLTVKA